MSEEAKIFFLDIKRICSDVKEGENGTYYISSDVVKMMDHFYKHQTTNKERMVYIDGDRYVKAELNDKR